jgi:hypothetical protein
MILTLVAVASLPFGDSGSKGCFNMRQALFYEKYALHIFFLARMSW